MGRQHRITYKIYPNTRLNELSLHGVPTHPLYIQITYRRRNAIFKSYYFDLFSKQRYATDKKRKWTASSVNGIAAMESKVIDYIIEKEGNDTTLERLQESYYFHSQDLCISSEESFGVNLYLLLMETGKDTFARTIANGSESEILYDLMLDMKGLLKEEIYNEILSESLKRNQFYPYLYGFMLENTKPLFRTLSVMDWLSEGVQDAFSDYLQRTGVEENTRMIENVNKWVDYLRKKK